MVKRKFGDVTKFLGSHRGLHSPPRTLGSARTRPRTWPRVLHRTSGLGAAYPGQSAVGRLRKASGRPEACSECPVRPRSKIPRRRTLVGSDTTLHQLCCSPRVHGPVRAASAPSTTTRGRFSVPSWHAAPATIPNTVIVRLTSRLTPPCAFPVGRSASNFKYSPQTEQGHYFSTSRNRVIKTHGNIKAGSAVSP